jgi:hypothetical protein
MAFSPTATTAINATEKAVDLPTPRGKVTK